MCVSLVPICCFSAPYRDNPPVETEVLLGGGLVEIHIGRGIWQTTAGAPKPRG